MRGTVDVLEDVVRTLRADGDLVAKLPDAEAIYQSHPTSDRGYGVAVVVTPIYEGSTPHRGVVQRRYRLQVTVTATTAWREARDDEAGTDGLRAMYGILDAVADVLDTAGGVPEWPTEAPGGPAPRAVGDGRLAVSGDWLVSGAYVR